MSEQREKAEQMGVAATADSAGPPRSNGEPAGSALLIDTIVKAVPLLSVGLYALGFVVVHSRLSSFAVADVSLINPRYLLAGLDLCIYVFLFCWVVLTHVSQVDKLPPIRGDGTRTGAVLAFLENLNVFILDVVFRIIAAGVLFSWTAFVEIDRADPLNLVLMGTLAWTMLIDKRASGGIALIRQATRVIWRAIILVAYLIFGDNETYLVGFSYFAILAVGTIIQPHLKSPVAMLRYGAGVYAAVVALGLATAFGSTIYAHVSPQLGGGAPLHVQVLAKETISLPSIHQDAEKRFAADLIAGDDKGLLLSVAGKPIYLKADLFEGFEAVPGKTSSELAEETRQRYKAKWDWLRGIF